MPSESVEFATKALRYKIANDAAAEVIAKEVIPRADRAFAVLRGILRRLDELEVRVAELAKRRES